MQNCEFNEGEHYSTLHCMCEESCPLQSLVDRTEDCKGYRQETLGCWLESSSKEAPLGVMSSKSKNSESPFDQKRNRAVFRGAGFRPVDLFYL